MMDYEREADDGSERSTMITVDDGREWTDRRRPRRHSLSHHRSSEVTCPYRNGAGDNVAGDGDDDGDDDCTKSQVHSESDDGKHRIESHSFANRNSSMRREWTTSVGLRTFWSASVG